MNWPAGSDCTIASRSGGVKSIGAYQGVGKRFRLTVTSGTMPYDSRIMLR